MAETLVSQLSQKFDPKKFHDTYTEKLMKIIEAKAKGRKVKPAAERKQPKGEVFDLMAALKASLEDKKVKAR
jgi:DNA end-binding protein Ku